MSKSQKARKYSADGGPPGGAGSSAARTQARPARVHDMDPAAFAPQPTQSSSPALVVGVVLGVGLALWLYYHFLVLPGFSRTAAGGLPAPELLVGGFDAGYAQQFAAVLGEQGRSAYRGLHSTTGLFAPLLLALGWLTFSGANTPERTRKWVYWTLGLGYAVIFVLSNTALENAVGNPGDAEVVGVASALVITRWVLLGALLIAAILVSASVTRRKLNDFAEGKLPGQRPRG